MGCAGPIPPAHQTLLSRAPRTRPRRNPPCAPVSRRAGACVGCWMLTAWAKESVWVLGLLISSAVVQYIQSMCLPASRTKPHCAPLGFCSLPSSTPPFPLATPPLSPCFLGPIFLFPGLLPGVLPLEHATCCLSCTPHHVTTLASPNILYPDLPEVAPVQEGLAAARTSPVGVSWQPMLQSINRPLTAHPANF
ncbi:hypothetical protein F5883DRAFT_59921 [Diaporthe sp. PMI_573]|nr:hypothetical protein F5883DRAFT_59921 [Diaporthaceae sp. PMI_573]